MEQPDSAEHRHRGPRRGRGRGQREQGGSQQSAIPTQSQRPPTKPRRPPRSEQSTDGATPAPAPSSSAGAPPRPSRRDKFKATLSEVSQAQPSEPSSGLPAERARRDPQPRKPPGDDLTSTLTHALRTPPFPDCPICFNTIRPEHTTWSCSPPTSAEAPLGDHGQDTDKSHCCWSTFHLKCIRAWADKSVKELAEAWRARGEVRPGEWRCPGCRATRQAVPQAYMCFCLRMRNPAPPRIATPHSCAQPCSRTRVACRHACPLPCHPGPCPPCAVTIQAACFCGKERHSAKCRAGETAVSFSCSQPCHKPLQCGNLGHRCVQKCHEGSCPPCPAQEEMQCWCGRQTKLVACGEVKVGDSTKCVIIKDDGSEQVWIGSYGCGHPCERPFACSNHSCSKPCHPPSRTPPPCPFDPERAVSCACGQRNVARSFNEFAAGSSAHTGSTLLPPRTACTSALPTCNSPCSKVLSCGHLCQVTCHWGPCPPCTEQVERTCRCGATKHKTPCSDAVLLQHSADGGTTLASETILCDKSCKAMRSCGRHPCERICCPLGPLQRIKPTKRRDPSHTDPEAYLQLDPVARALHQCDLPCDRVLGCGNHRCQERDHKLPCPPCPRGVFEELVCLCGRTTLEPPIQCGTRLRCVYPCARPVPSCGHPQLTHACHEGVVVAGADTADEGLGLGEEGEGRPCPPCVILTDKLCACGKKRMGNVRCSQEKVSCGTACGKLLACGFHHCDRPCHADPCGMCTAMCGKPRKSCLPAHHPCTQTCHAPTACPETEPCLTPVTLTCPCGNLRSSVPCSGTRLSLACTGECEIKKRNARLAEALGITEEKREGKGKMTWSTEIVASARGMGPRFVGIVEKAFADFITSDRRTQVLPHMKPDQRKFVHDLAFVYRMDRVMVDQEPNRSVQLIRRIDTRVPTPLLSQHIASTMGRLVDSRLVAGKSAGISVGAGTSFAPVAGPSGASGSTGAGWNAVARSALGATSRSGSTTPARVPSPGLGPTRLAGAGKVSSSTTSADEGPKGGSVWVSSSVQALRGRGSAQSVGGSGSVSTAMPVVGAGAGAVATGVAQQTIEVPDDWEDDT